MFSIGGGESKMGAERGIKLMMLPGITLRELTILILRVNNNKCAETISAHIAVSPSQSILLYYKLSLSQQLKVPVLEWPWVRKSKVPEPLSANGKSF